MAVSVDYSESRLAGRRQMEASKPVHDHGGAPLKVPLRKSLAARLDVNRTSRLQRAL